MLIKKLFLSLLAAIALTACSNDPEYHGLTPGQKEAYGKAIAGEYDGTYIIIMLHNDGSNYTEKVQNVQMTITDQTMHSVQFHDFPVSMLSKLVANPALAEALATAPNADFMADYRFYSMPNSDDVNWGFELANVPLTLHYSGADHHLLLRLSSGVYCELTKASLDAGTPFAHLGGLQFDVTGIYEGDTLVQALDGWQDNNRFIAYFQLNK